jgi:hypothetical protein
MTRPIRVGVLLQPGNAPDYATWRIAVLRAEELGAELIFGWDHGSTEPRIQGVGDAEPTCPIRPDAPRRGLSDWTAGM